MSSQFELTTTFIPHLKTQFARGSVVLFTGAGFSLDAINVAGQPLLSAKSLVQELYDKSKAVSRVLPAHIRNALVENLHVERR
jgi:hypothetical protein